VIPDHTGIANPGEILVLPFSGLLLGELLQFCDHFRVIFNRLIVIKRSWKVDDFTSSCEAISVLLTDIVNSFPTLTRL
jgi:hypothetical protein